MKTLYVIFHEKYRNNTHPEWAPAHSDMILAVQAETYMQCQDLVKKHISGEWVGIFQPAAINMDNHPRGVTHLLTKDGIVEAKELEQ